MLTTTFEDVHYFACICICFFFSENGLGGTGYTGNSVKNLFHFLGVLILRIDVWAVLVMLVIEVIPSVAVDLGEDGIPKGEVGDRGTTA